MVAEASFGRQPRLDLSIDGLSMLARRREDDFRAPTG
jgi:hypothetical protein